MATQKHGLVPTQCVINAISNHDNYRALLLPAVVHSLLFVVAKTIQNMYEYLIIWLVVEERWSGRLIAKYYLNPKRVIAVVYLQILGACYHSNQNRQPLVARNLAKFSNGDLRRETKCLGKVGMTNFVVLAVNNA